MKAYRIGIVKFDGEGNVISRGVTELYRDREEGGRTVSGYIGDDYRFGVEIVEVEVTAREWKKIRE